MWRLTILGKCGIWQPIELCILLTQPVNMINREAVPLIILPFDVEDYEVAFNEGMRTLVILLTSILLDAVARNDYSAFISDGAMTAVSGALLGVAMYNLVIVNVVRAIRKRL